LPFELRRLIPYKERVTDHPATEITAATRYCAVLGHPVRHSASPVMQNAGFAALDLPWRYLAFDVSPDRLPEAIRGAQAMRFIGLNLTVPHKLLALDLVDELDGSAREWGAVNTIRFEARDAEGRWQPLGHSDQDAPGELRARGFNTDADAMARALREDLGMELAGATVCLLGAGGAGRVAALKLASAGVSRLHLLNRTLSKAEGLAAEVRGRFPGVATSVSLPVGDVDLVVNATSLGLRPDDPLPLEPERFPLRRTRAVYDMIYRPAETPLMRAARAAGCRTANGIGMLLYQGAQALELWSGKIAPLGPMRAALERSVRVP
jgi:shikimate dehydrogenase